MVNPIPDEYPQLSPYICVDGAAEAIDFYVEVFGGVERMRMPGPNDTIGHAEVQVGKGVIMLADEFPDIDFRGPRSVGGTPVVLHLYVEDVDAVFQRAVKAGATPLEEPEDQFYGDRSGRFEDPFGHRWNVSSHIEDISPEEMARRGAEASGADH